MHSMINRGESVNEKHLRIDLRERARVLMDDVDLH